MTAEQFTPQIPRRDPKEELEGSFCTRVTVTEGTRTPSGLKAPVGSPNAGNIHRNSVKEYKPVDTTQVYTTVHRPAHSPSSEFDLGGLTRTQERMLSDRQKSKNKKAK